MKIRILPRPWRTWKGGKTFYENQGEGLGDYFTNSLFSDIDSLALYGGIHARHWGYHRLLARRFPHAIYYHVNQDVGMASAGLQAATEKA